ncbi:deoxyribodipyrimidine photo-lyase-like [Mytilus californianus]|uniref:deoxyribodipyrimidine photo-lyase-like n=1 Tax=Mytilus californianus TaxID=6549 RepID=UPI002247ACAB|nr:deoxyribodipyrimidine photo-lyase-like [Mytilus californianus]
MSSVWFSFGRESQEILNQYSNGNCEADECFCMILSLEGYDKTRNHFINFIENLKVAKPILHNCLVGVFKNYFSETEALHSKSNEAVGCSVENGFLTSDFGFELDMELAKSLSLSDCNPKKTITPLLNESSNEPAGSALHKRFNKRQNIQPVPHSLNGNNANNEGHLKASIPGLQVSDFPNSKHKKKKKKGNSLPRQISNPPVIYWLRRDLRMYDNPALVAAASSNAAVLLVFIWSDHEEDPLDVVATGGATKLWLHYALQFLNQSFLEKFGNGILYYNTKTENSYNIMKQIILQTGANTLFLNDVYEPFLKERDDALCNKLSKSGIQCNRFHSYLLHEPSSINTESLGMRGIGSVTHFMECSRQSSVEPIGLPIESPGILPKCMCIPNSQTLDDLELAKMPRRKNGSMIDWAAPIVKSWNFSEDGGWDALGSFLTEGIKKYEKESCRADHVNTCRISPYLHFGQISPRAILTEAKHMKSPKFLRKLAWRDLSYWLLSLWPDLPSQPTRPQYRHQRWSKNKAHLKAWQRGNTGFPLVDAAMRQLWLTGWMNNYMRHVVASFLISYLHLHWIEGYRWFQDTLLDADVAINAMMWQNGGMSGLDQWNFVMHPIDAAMTCDPDGTYVRQWCPEIASVPNEFIHRPWKCPPSIMKRCKVELGIQYPNRIITNLEVAREQSLQDVVEVRKKFPDFVDRRSGNDLVPVDNGRLLIPVITRMEFKYKTTNPEAKDNPHTAVLRGYRSRKRDEAIAFANERDFLASTMNECVQRQERHEKALKQGNF